MLWVKKFLKHCSKRSYLSYSSAASVFGTSNAPSRSAEIVNNQQQEQLLFNVTQCYSQLLQQQTELSDLKRRVSQVVTYLDDQ